MPFHCKRCGQCCNPPHIFKQDIKRLESSGLKDFVYTDNLDHTYLKDKGGWCMFLKKGKIAECTIYMIRPKTCRLYPSELNNGDCRPIELAFDDYLENIPSHD
ncbi:MAG TPA: YkgJ family cysteine cluster protein [Candidatus Nanoarchaeia archaeon]|nr:YkgJ family cysteine cluster protein [Candidatus Nanoarchaeia archaeon]